MAETTEKGLFIAIEGGDGSGKGTQAELLRLYAENVLAMHVLKLSFPQYEKESAYYAGRYLNGEYGGVNDVHADLASLAYAIDRFSAKNEIIDHLKKPRSLVISDRYVGSNLAHQGTKIQDRIARLAFYERMMNTEHNILGIPRPDINVVIVMPTDIAQANVDKKEARSYTTKKRDIHEADALHLDRAKANYEELCELYPSFYIPIQGVDTSGNQRTIDDIEQEIRRISGLDKLI